MISTTASLLVSFALFAALSSASAQDQLPPPLRAARMPPRHFDERPPLQLEEAPTDKSPGRALVTNLYQETLTAFALEVEREPGSQEMSRIEVFDAIAVIGMKSGVPRGLTLIIGVPHVVGKPIPSAKIAAAMWEDGSTFGSQEILDKIFANRRTTLSAYDLVLSILQTGEENGWTLSQYIDALEKEKAPLPILTEPPRVSMPFQPNTTIQRVEISLRSAQGPGSSVAINPLLPYYRKEREQLARSLTEVPQNAKSIQ